MGKYVNIWKEDPTNPTKMYGYVYPHRFKLLDYLGVNHEQMLKYCYKFRYKQYIIDCLDSDDDYNMFEKYFDSWNEMRYQGMKMSSKRRRGRTCYNALKDLSSDGIFMDTLRYIFGKYFPDLHFIIGNGDYFFDLNSTANIDADFKFGKDEKDLEMKITSDGTKWSNKTITIRNFNENNDGVEQNLMRYMEENPDVIFLHIFDHTNPEKCGGNTCPKFIIFKGKDVRPSKSNDGSVYYKFKDDYEDDYKHEPNYPINIPPNFKDFVGLIHNELKKYDENTSKSNQQE